MRKQNENSNLRDFYIKFYTDLVLYISMLCLFWEHSLKFSMKIDFFTRHGLFSIENVSK